MLLSLKFHHRNSFKAVQGEANMTDREMMLMSLRRGGYRKVPGDMMLTPPQEEQFRNHVGAGVDVESYFDLSHRSTRPDYLPGYSGDGMEIFEGQSVPEHFSVDPFGVGESRGSEEAYHMVHFHSPLEGADTPLSKIIDHPLPRIAEGRQGELKGQVDRFHREGFAVMGWLEQTIWERAWLIRGMNDLMMDMMSDDERAEAILDRLTEHSCRTARLYAETDHDIIALGDDVGMQSSLMMSPELWRKWLKPRLARVIQTIREHRPQTLVFYHSCGFIEPLIPELIEVGVDILNPVQPESMSFRKIHDLYGHQLSFWGGVGTQTTLPFGSPSDVAAQVREMVEICGEKGGCVPAPTHVVEPEVPWENLEAYRKCLQELSRVS